MTRKHFIKLANLLANTKLSIKRKSLKTPKQVYEYIADSIADLCSQENEYFDRDRFEAFIEKAVKESKRGIYETHV